MNNQSFFVFFFPSFLDLLPDLIFAYVFFMLFGFVALLRYTKKRQGDARAGIEPRCV